jgi:hypothetical protein
MVPAAKSGGVVGPEPDPRLVVLESSVVVVTDSTVVVVVDSPTELLV